MMITIVFFCISLLGVSQTIHQRLSVAYLGVGAYSNNHVDAFSWQSNQASLAKITSASAGIYGEKRFLLNELSLYQASIVISVPPGNFGLDTRYYGFSDYNETQLGLAYGKSLGDKVDIGVQFNYSAIRVTGYGSVSAVNFELGTILHLTDKLNAGLHIYNPVGGKLRNEQSEKLASIYSAAIGYEPSQKFFINMEIEKVETEPVNIKAGLQYEFLPQVLTRIGVSTEMSIIYFGVGFRWNSFRLDTIASYHPQLGITPGLLLLYAFNRKEK
jgi:hypothetical protein